MSGRRLRYQAACSVDGYIAGPHGEIDWITGGEDFDFSGLLSQFDTLLMGRRTYAELPGGSPGMGGMRVVVVSRTLRQEDHAGVEIIADDVAGRVADLKRQPGQVDTVEPAIIPVLLGGGVPMFPAGAPRARLSLTRERAYAGGMVLLEYAIAT